MLDRKIAMIGCTDAGWYTIKALLKSGICFNYFICISHNDVARYKISGYKDFTDLAHEYGIPIYYVKSYSLKNEEDILFFNEHQFDLVVQGGWQRLFPDEVLKTLSIGAIGIHGSSDYLPKGRGRSPLNWSLIEGKSRFIMHLFLIKPGIDDGDVFDCEMFDINLLDTIKTLYYKNSIVTTRMLIRSIPKLLNGDVSFMPQTGIPSYYSKREPEDGLINWEEMDVYHIYNFVRAQTKPYPGAFGYIEDKCYKIWECKIFDTRITYPDNKYGDCVEKFDHDLIINCRGGLLLIYEYELVSYMS